MVVAAEYNDLPQTPSAFIGPPCPTIEAFDIQRLSQNIFGRTIPRVRETPPTRHEACSAIRKDTARVVDQKDQHEDAQAASENVHDVFEHLLLEQIEEHPFRTTYLERRLHILEQLVDDSLS